MTWHELLSLTPEFKKNVLTVCANVLQRTFYKIYAVHCWKNLLNTANVNLRQQQNRKLEFPLQLGDDVVNLPLLISKKLYWQLVSHARVSPTSMHKYNTLFPNHIIKWDQIFSIPFKVTLDVRTRCFQFNLLHRIVYTNNLLYKMNFTDSNLCSFCEEAEESLEHLFFECKASQDFWKSVISWLTELDFGINALDKIDIMLGYTTHNTRFWTLLNHIIIICKQIIFLQSAKKISTFPHLIAKLKYTECIENHIAFQNNSLDFHKKKWRPVLNILS